MAIHLRNKQRLRTTISLPCSDVAAHTSVEIGRGLAHYKEE